MVIGVVNARIIFIQSPIVKFGKSAILSIMNKSKIRIVHRFPEKLPFSTGFPRCLGRF